MGIHVMRTRRGVVVRYFQHAGENLLRKAIRYGRGGGGSGSTKSTPKSGGSAGTRGDFGADFE